MAIGTARWRRDEAIVRLVAEHGVTATSKLVGMSVSHVKACRQRVLDHELPVVF
jgi:hypothetical protein